jgi:putative flavoprotein involved in K+ transport
MKLYGMLKDGSGTELSFLPTLTKALDSADEVYNSICRDIDAFIEREGLDVPDGPSAYEPVWAPEQDPTSLDLAAAGITSVVWAIGYRPDYRFVKVGVFDGSGRPTHTRGITSAEGLYFLGIPWLHTWGSGRFLGIAQDAEHLTSVISRAVKSPLAPALEAS